MLNEDLMQKWQPIIEHPDLDKIGDVHKRNVTAVMLENTETALQESAGFNPQSLLEAAPTNAMGASSSTAGDGAVDGERIRGIVSDSNIAVESKPTR